MSVLTQSMFEVVFGLRQLCRLQTIFPEMPNPLSTPLLVAGTAYLALSEPISEAFLVVISARSGYTSKLRFDPMLNFAVSGSKSRKTEDRGISGPVLD